MGRRRYRRARHRRTLAIVFVVFLLVCLGVLVAVVAVNALAFEGPDSRAPVLLPDSQQTPILVALDAGFLASPIGGFAPIVGLEPKVEVLNQKYAAEVTARSPTSHARVARLACPYATTAPTPKGARPSLVARRWG